MANAGPEIILVRHGETEWSASGQHTGRTDIPLTDNGRSQAEHVRTRLHGRRFGTVLTSPLSRAVETCRIAGFGGVAKSRDELLEWDYGAYEGRTTPQIREERPGWFLWRDGCPGGETAAEVAARVDPLVAELRDATEDVLLFSHGHLLRVLASRWIECGPELGGHLPLGTASVSVLGRERESPGIWLWNGAAHLAAHAGEGSQ
jgi:probable phosphoglycerate mutase